MSGTGEILYLRAYDRMAKSYYPALVVPSTLNFQSDVRQFSGTVDLSIKINNEEDLAALKSHDFIELFFYMPDGKEHQVGVCYLEDYSNKTNSESMVKQFNGAELVAQMMKPPFAVTKHFESMTLLSFCKEAAKGEYISVYGKLKNRTPVFGVSHNSVKMRMSSDLTQTKGALIQQYADLAINIVYQNRLGQMVIYGGIKDRASKGILKKGNNISSLSVAGSYSKVLSEVVTFYSSAQAVIDKNKVKAPTVINDDPRVRGVVYNPTIKTFASNDLAVFDTTPEKRMKEVAKSLLRKSNSYLAQVIIELEKAYYTDNESGKHTAYEKGQVWTIESDVEEIKTREFPNGTRSADMELAGIFYSQDDGKMSVQLLFVEEGTLI